MTLRLEVVAAQLVTAAQCALRGDAEALEAQIQQTSALLRAGSSPTQRSQKGALATWRANRVLAYIEANLGNQILVTHLSRQVGLSHGHLMRSFKVRFGITIRVYITCRRLATAQQQMVTTSEPLCAIALKCGMCDQAHFCRVFRRFIGLSPSRWREMQLDAQSRSATSEDVQWRRHSIRSS
jgi:transcriptional regulator GlxA family with amidase domain